MDTRNIALASLILGGAGVILTIVLWNTSPWLGLVFGIAGNVLSVKSNKIEKTVIASTGFALSLISIIAFVILLVVYLAYVAFNTADSLGIIGALQEFM